MSIELAWDPTCYANIDRVALPLNDKPGTAIYGVFFIWRNFKMIKCETIGQLDVAKINPVLKSASDVTNNSFIVVNGITYLILNDIHGDDAYKDGVTIKAGDFLNGYDVSAWAGQKLVVDEKHIAYGSGDDYDDLVAEDVATSTSGTMLKVASSGKLEVASTAPTSGVYFVVTDKVTLTEKAVKVRVTVVDEDTHE